MRSSYWSGVIGFLAVIMTAIAFVPSGAHVAELSHKLGLRPDHYMITQGLYAGWALFGIPTVAALLLTLCHVFLVRERLARWLSLLGFLALAGSQLIFWLFTQPMNVLTHNWTVMPPDLAAARWQWEMSHAAIAAVTAVALVCVTAGALVGARERS